VDIQNRLAGQLAQRLGDPATVSEGLTLFPETAQRGEVSIRPPAREVIGTHVGEFQLIAEASGSALAVDESLIEQVALVRLERDMPAGFVILPGSVLVDSGEGQVDDGSVRYVATAEGRGYTRVDEDEILARVTGLSVPDARSILDAYGTSSVTVWPDFVGNLPDDPGRISVTVVDPEAGSE
jgi:hypothetical protein